MTPGPGVPSLAVQGAPGEAGERPDGPERAPSTTSTVHRLGLKGAICKIENEAILTHLTAHMEACWVGGHPLKKAPPTGLLMRKLATIDERARRTGTEAS